MNQSTQGIVNMLNLRYLTKNTFFSWLGLILPLKSQFRLKYWFVSNQSVDPVNWSHSFTIIIHIKPCTYIHIHIYIYIYIYIYVSHIKQSFSIYPHFPSISSKFSQHIMVQRDQSMAPFSTSSSVSRSTPSVDPWATWERGSNWKWWDTRLLDFDIPKMRIWHGMTWDNMGQSDRRGNFTGSIINLIWFQVSVNIWYWIRYNLQLECRTWWKGLDTSLDFDSCLAGHMDKTPFLMRLSQA